MPEPWLAYQHLACKDCGLPMLLPGDVLRQLFAYPSSPSNDSLAIGALCPRCNFANTYILRDKAPGHNPKDGAVMAPGPYEHTVIVGPLKCDAEDCTSLLDIVFLFPKSLPEQQQLAIFETWKIGKDLRCPSGHPIRNRTLLTIRSN
jgi:hypothetical protein